MTYSGNSWFEHLHQIKELPRPTPFPLEDDVTALLPGTTRAGWQRACEGGGTSPNRGGRALLQPSHPHKVPEKQLPVENCLTSSINRTQSLTKRPRSGSVKLPKTTHSLSELWARSPGQGRVPRAQGCSHRSRRAPHLLPLVVGLSHLDVPHQAAPCARVQDVDNGGHEVIDVH